MRKWWHPWKLLLATVMLAACGGSSAGDTTDANTSSAASADSGAQPDAQAVVVEYDVSELSNEHIEPPTAFEQSPPVGGDHYPFWQNCGFYSVPVIEGAAVHSMEHGAVWVTYNTDLVTGQELQALSDLAANNDRLLISPYPHDERLVLSSWGAQLRLADAEVGDTAVADFISKFADRDGIPEPGVSCAEAVGDPPSDPRALQDGSSLDAAWS